MSDLFKGPCQFCMAGSSFGSEPVQLVLHDGRWQPWPLVAALPIDAPVILAEVCPACDRERFNEEEVPRLNRKIAERNQIVRREPEEAMPIRLTPTGARS